MEKLIPVIDQYCTFPVLEKLKLFKITLFCFLIGNEDMHLKNFSLIRRPEKIELTPAYDLINSAIILHSTEELALPLCGKKSKLARKHLIDYFGKERLGLSTNSIQQEEERFRHVIPEWKELIQASFLSDQMKKQYIDHLQQKVNRLYPE